MDTPIPDQLAIEPGPICQAWSWPEHGRRLTHPRSFSSSALASPLFGVYCVTGICVASFNPRERPSSLVIPRSLTWITLISFLKWLSILMNGFSNLLPVTDVIANALQEICCLSTFPHVSCP